jgi:hypothetical protein
MTSETDKLLKKYKNPEAASQSDSLEKLTNAAFLAQMRVLILDSHATYTSLRKKWSRHIARAFWTVLTFELVFISALGLGIVEYRDYTALPQIIIGSFFAQIVGLAIIVAKFLFPDSPKTLFPTSSKK